MTDIWGLATRSLIVDSNDNVATVQDRTDRPTGKALNVQIGPKDSATDAPIFIDYAHHEAHAGSFFRSGMNFTLSNGQVATLGFVTPNTTKWCHMTWDLSTSADGTFTLLEDVTSFSGGASITALNHNRNSSTASGVTLTRGMTGSDLITPTGGTAILNAVLSTGKGNTINRSTGQEFILKQNSNYLFRYTNGTSANVIQLALEWYEHTNRS